MSWGQTFSQKGRTSLRLFFWRITAWMIDGIVRHKATIRKLLPYAPLIGYGAISYTVGWVIGKVLLAVLA